MTFVKSRFGAKLPIAPEPLAGESLGGWYTRTSNAYAVEIQEGLPILDLSEHHGERVSAETILNLSKKLSHMTDIKSKVWERMIGSEVKLTNMWLKYQSDAEYCLPHLPDYYCIECFLEDLETFGQTYYRAEWASSFVLSCHKHRSPFISNKLISSIYVRTNAEVSQLKNRINHLDNYEVLKRSITKAKNSYLSPMAQRVSDLFSLDDKVARTALKNLGRHNDLDTARSTALGVLQILSFRSWETPSQCLGRILFHEKYCNEFIESRSYNRREFCQMSKDELITCFEQVGWFICHPTKYHRYGLTEYSRIIPREFRSEELAYEIEKDQMVLLFALLIYFQQYSFLKEIAEHHPLFDKEWSRAAKVFYSTVDKRFYR